MAKKNDNLKNPQCAADYLNASLTVASGKAEERFLTALRDVAKAYGMTELAKSSGIARQAMYRALSDDGNPELSTLKALLDALGLRLAVEHK